MRTTFKLILGVVVACLLLVPAVSLAGQISWPYSGYGYGFIKTSENGTEYWPSTYQYSSYPYNYNYNQYPYNYNYNNYRYYSPLSVTCYPSTRYTSPGQTYLTWYANASGGNGYYTYSWTGTDNPINQNNSVLNVFYTYPGNKSMRVTVTANGQTTSADCGTAYFSGGYGYNYNYNYNYNGYYPYNYNYQYPYNNYNNYPYGY